MASPAECQRPRGSERERSKVIADNRLRRWIGAVAFLMVLGIIAAVIPRLGVRSPVLILVVCVMAVLTMKLVEHRVHRWFQHWAEKEANRPTPPRARS